MRAIAEVVLAERRHHKAPKLALVWTGDDPGISHSRHTRVVLPELFARAREHVMWPFGAPRPVVYFDPRTADKYGAMSMHAKCMVVDHEHTLITSANFTDRGQTRNVEAGVAIEDRAFAASLERQWLNLVDAGVVVRA